MEALQLLESEHDDLEALVAKLEQARGTEARRLFTAVKDQYELIKALEGTHLYPQLRDDDLARDIVLEGSVEHSLIDTLFDELSQVKPDDPVWQPKVHVLKLALEHHFPEEETQLFPGAVIGREGGGRTSRLVGAQHSVRSFPRRKSIV